MAHQHMRRTRRLFTTGLLLAALSLAACGGDEPTTGRQVVSQGDGDQTTYGQDRDVIVTADGTTYVINGQGEGCVTVDGTCQDIAAAEGKYCGEEGGQTDIVVDADGNVAEAVCFPAPKETNGTEEIIVTEEGKPELPQNASGAVIVFNEDTEGDLLKGDLKISGERTTLYGRGVDETILDGNLSLESNNARVRGMTIQKDFSVSKNSNNAAISFLTVHGDVTIEGNSFRAIELIVFGNVKVTGNDARFVNLGVGGKWEASGKVECVSCYSFDDEHEDFVIQESERTDWTDGQPPAEM